MVSERNRHTRRIQVKNVSSLVCFLYTIKNMQRCLRPDDQELPCLARFLEGHISRVHSHALSRDDHAWTCLGNHVTAEITKRGIYLTTTMADQKYLIVKRVLGGLTWRSSLWYFTPPTSKPKQGFCRLLRQFPSNLQQPYCSSDRAESAISG